MLIIERQKLANRKYRANEKGKKKTNEMHRIWWSKKKDDLEYNQHLKIKARERYHARKIKKKAESAENEICLGESEIKKEVTES